MIYVTCKYAPIEILKGFGEEVERLDPTPKNFECADSCGHPNMCSFVKAIIEEVHTKHITQIVLTDCCDATRRLYDILSLQPEMEFVYLLPFPHKIEEREIKLFESELENLIVAYENFSCKSFDESIAIQAYEKNIYEERPHIPYIKLLGAHGGKRLKEEIQKVMPNIPVVDDTCTGNRALKDTRDETVPFLTWYARVLLNQEAPCMRIWKNGGRDQMDSENVLGVVYHTIKFCDYYSFEYMLLKEGLAKPIIKIETDTTPQSSGQLKTRLEAFKEELGVEEKIKLKKISNGPLYTAGLDSGSASTDAVILNAEKKIIGRAIVQTGSGAESTATKALEIALKDAGLKKNQLSAVVSTGYGRENIGLNNHSVTEITCHARGAHYLNPDVRTVIDIGGQDSKVIRLDEKGNVMNFVMNDKCAAGTGRFLEMQARAMQISMEEMTRLGLQWKNPVDISSMCTVFAESEVVSLVAKNVPVEDIIHGLNMAVAKKTAALVSRVDKEPLFMMTGGVAKNAGVVQCLEEKLGVKIVVSEDSQVCGALGAALIAMDALQ